MANETNINKSVIKIAKQYAKKVSENYKTEAIILFGSYVKGTEHKDSDIDIAIVTDDLKDGNDAFDEQINLKKLRWGIDYRIEPHLISVNDYNNIETPFVKEVIDTGIKVA